MSEVHTEAERLRRIEEGFIRLETELPHLATREMVAEVRTDIANVRTDLRTEVGGVRSDIGQVEIRLIRWIIGTGVAAVIVLSAQLWGAVQLLLRLHP